MRQNRTDINDRKDDLAELLEEHPALARTFWQRLDVSWLYHESALEGIVITSEELTQALRVPAPVVEGGKAAFLADIRRHRQAIELVKEEAANPRSKLTAALAKKVFETLTSGEEGKGKIDFRKDMPLHRTYFHDIAQPPRIVPDFTKLFEWTASAEFAQLDALQQAVLFHHKFMAIFPFTDLSGKVGRLMMDVVLMRAGYLPAIIHAIDRQRYYEALRQQPRVLQGIIVEAIEHATDHGLKFFASQPRRASTPPRGRASGA